MNGLYISKLDTPEAGELARLPLRATTDESVEEEPDISHLLCDSSESDSEEETPPVTPKPFSDSPSLLLQPHEQQILRECSKFQGPTSAELSERAVQLGEPSKKKTLFLDLDETLVHSDKQESANFQCSTAKGECVRVGEDVFLVRKRPFVDLFLQEAALKFEIVAFTAGVQEYADKIVQLLDPNRRYFSRTLARDHCIPREGLFVKDLSIVRDRDLKDMVLVDNSLVSFSFNVDNGIPVTDFIAQDDDTQLKELAELLGKIEAAADVRTLLRDLFGLQRATVEC